LSTPIPLCPITYWIVIPAGCDNGIFSLCKGGFQPRQKSLPSGKSRLEAAPAKSSVAIFHNIFHRKGLTPYPSSFRSGCGIPWKGNLHYIIGSCQQFGALGKHIPASVSIIHTFTQCARLIRKENYHGKAWSITGVGSGIEAGAAAAHFKRFRAWNACT